MDKLSYALGHNIGHQLMDMGLETSLNVDDFAAAIRDLFTGKEAQLSAEESRQVLDRFFTEMEQLQQAEAEQKGKAAKSEGEAFLAANAKREGVFCTRSGLQYEILNEGNGPRPTAADTVRCHYEGTLIDGTVFDSSYRRNQPAEFGLRQVIAGWTEGVQMMKVGAKYKFYIPYQLGYGEHGAGNSIPPYAALIFTVELLAIV
ncbi:MAG: FKBP-type peptidyl-prolyl cis-trans isomerase [Bacteroidales bacterium]|jgi:FKBP-type peptidyl-prolyl cis-trans isomerase FklB|nr:FKBP-type peptidyl-prolyl cis-trans isomerase [Bacteroidales bacterium]